MSDPRRFTMTITGLTSLVMHNPAGLLGDKPDKGRDPAEWEREHFLDLTYRNANGQVIIPGHAIRKMLVNGCRFVTDKPKGSSFKSFGPLVEATLFIEEDAILDVPTDKVIPYVAIVNLNPSKGPKGPRGPRCRPMVPTPWSARTFITAVDEAITVDHLENIADVAGRLVGLLDGRTIGFGRCEISMKRVAG